MFAWHQRRQPFALAGWGEIVRTRDQPSAARLPACVSARSPSLALLGSTKTRGLRVDAAH